MQKEKSFYVVSGLIPDSLQFGALKQYETEADAIARAKEIITLRANKGNPPINFYVLKVVAVVSPVQVIAPVSVKRFK